MVLGYEIIALFKQESEVLRQDINVLMNRLMDSVDNVTEDVKPETYKDYKTLKANIKAQKDENELLLKTLDTIRRETVDQRERVAVCSERIMKMEEQVGMIAHNQAYFKDDEDELYGDSLNKNETIEHTREPSKKGNRDETLNNANSIETGLNLNVNSTTSSVEPKNWVPGQNMARAQSEIKVEQS